MRAGWQAISLWTRVTELPESSLTRKAMCVQRLMCSRGEECWLTKLKGTLLARVACGSELWSKWWSDPHFRVVCASDRVNEVGRNVVVRWKQECMACLKQYSTDVWRVDVTRVTGRNGMDGNKLRTYALFKSEFRLESYLTSIDDRRKRVLLTKFRIGICPLRIETGRREQVSRNKRRLPEHERVCQCCYHASDVVEDEVHFLVVCPAYEALRMSLFEVIRSEYSILASDLEVRMLDPKSLFRDMMASENIKVVNSLASFLYKAFRLREKLVLE